VQYVKQSIPTTSQFDPATATNTAPGVLEVLKERIVRHQIPPGSKLPEESLSAEFGVSRAHIREALGTLCERGLVSRAPNRGAVVARLDLEQATHLYAIREVLEGLCVRLATLALPCASWQDLVDLFGRPIQDDVERNDMEGYITKVELLRARSVLGAGNPILADLLNNIQDRTRMITRRVILLPGRAAVGMEEHRRVLEAMRRGDAAGAEMATRANIRSSMEYLRRYQAFVL
jgi:DNA-binding GntR family transcriptional regulator